MRGKLAPTRRSRYIRDMANTASLFDLVDEDAKRRVIDEGIAAIEAGNHVERKVVSEWLKKLAAAKS